jgi:hypothetical protein
MKSKIFVIITTVLIGFSLSYLYSNIVISHPREKLKEFRKKVYLKGKRARQDFELSKDAYLLKIKSIVKENQPKEIFVNGFQLTPDIYHYIRRRGDIETSYVHLPRQIIREGRNSIKINFLKNRPKDVEIILANYRKQIGNDIYILFSDSVAFPSGNLSFKTTLLAIILIFLVFGVMSYLLSRILYLTINRLFLYQIYSLLPFLAFLSCLWIGGNLSRLYKVVLTPSYFWTFGLVSFFVTEGGLVSRKLLRGHRKKDIEVKTKEPLIINLKAITFVTKIFDWIKTREFSDKCVLLFMALLIMCAFLLVLHLEKIAEQLANVAYFALVMGVVIKFIRLMRGQSLKDRKKR